MKESMPTNGPPAPKDDGEFPALLQYLRLARGFDFTGYKRASLMRLTVKRMHRLGIETFAGYVDYLEVNPEEFTHLFNCLLINVTGFFRDATAWEFIASHVIPQILASRKPPDPIRVWSAGCASGQEAFTVAILLAEAMGTQAFIERVKIYATDVDEEALAQARQATYPLNVLQGVPDALRAKYFEESRAGWSFRRDLRRAMTFGRHELIQDAPISQLDLLTCRNTLMYFNAEAQRRILNRLHFALNDGGFLFLGKAEMMLTRDNMFQAVDLKHRVFVKVPSVDSRERLPLLPARGADSEGSAQVARHLSLKNAAFAASPLAQIVVDSAGRMIMANHRMREAFGIAATDLGRPLQDLQVSYRPLELRSRIEEAYAERSAVQIGNVEWLTAEGELRYLDVQIIPLLDYNDTILGVTIAFDDVTRYRKLHKDFLRSKEEIAAAYEEIHTTNEELETTNEELQSTNEELETTNEELQSSNEELETMNEELQSSNQELQAVNEALHRRTEELNQTNDFLQTVLVTLRVGIVVLSEAGVVTTWNDVMRDMWGLRADEVQGLPLSSLDIGLPVSELQAPVQACLAGALQADAMVLPATNRRGKRIHCQVRVRPLSVTDAARKGVILLVDEVTVATP